MKAVNVVVLVVAAALAQLAAAEDNRDKLIPEYMAASMDCVKDYEMDFTVCKEMMKEGVNLAEEKYTPCKCVSACVAKKRKLMSEDGEYDVDAFRKAVYEFGYAPWSEEYDKVYPVCKDSYKGKKNCDAAGALAVCAWKNSKMMRDTIGQYMGQLDE
ncbi:GTPase Obg [Frankliniella fusca]|uniref:GTPase Obg n=1 Tax=Frankliniella fusca TaxID=407009 RepID=A0AAE1LUE0_9NEOP|nr:GTPase Obg [Frankliniella fusca]